MEPKSSLTVLVAEDDLLSRQLLSSYLGRNGHQVLEVENGQEAISCFGNHSVDLVILDVKMPVMDGLDACRYLKGQMQGRWAPIIMISSNDEEQDQVMGLNVGADYYLTKPISFPILEATVKSSQRIASLQRELEARNQELSAYYRNSRAENDLAQQIIERILRNSTSSDTSIHQSVRAAEQFSGDVVSIVNSQSGNTYAMLADATGHGLPAAITLMPAMELFYQMSRRGYGISSIARRINHRLREHLPPNYFLAATMVLIDPQRQTLAAWNGSSPEGYVLSPSGAITHRIPSAHPPLGVLNDDEFDDTTQLCTVEVEDRFFACTDGLTDARNEHGEMFGRQRLRELLQQCTSGQDLIQEVTDALTSFRGRVTPDDDQSMLTLSVEPPLEAEVGTRTDLNNNGRPLTFSPSARELAGWDFQIELRGPDIRSIEVVPTINQVMENLNLEDGLRQKAFVALTELINNAIDHGLLELDSSFKGRGFEAYVEERQSRLEELEHGFIRIMATRTHYQDRSALRLMVMDSGAGFSVPHQTTTDASGEPSWQAYGRGIRVVASLADSLRFLDHGATAEVEFITPGAAHR